MMLHGPEYNSVGGGGHGVVLNLSKCWEFKPPLVENEHRRLDYQHLKILNYRTLEITRSAHRQQRKAENQGSHFVRGKADNNLLTRVEHFCLGSIQPSHGFLEKSDTQ